MDERRRRAQFLEEVVIPDRATSLFFMLNSPLHKAMIYPATNTGTHTKKTTMQLFTCRNCGDTLTVANQQRALAEIVDWLRTDPVPWSELSLYCPSYNAATDGCAGWVPSDDEQPAYWALD